MWLREAEGTTVETISTKMGASGVKKRGEKRTVRTKEKKTTGALEKPALKLVADNSFFGVCGGGQRLLLL